MRRAKGQIDKLASSLLADSGIGLESMHAGPAAREHARDTRRGGGGRKKKKLTGKQLPQHDLIFPGGKKTGGEPQIGGG